MVRMVSNFTITITAKLTKLLDHDPIPDLVTQLAQEVYRTDLLQLLVLNIQKFEFEVSK